MREAVKIISNVFDIIYEIRKIFSGRQIYMKNDHPLTQRRVLLEHC